MINYSTLLDSPDFYDELIVLIQESFSYKEEHSYAVDFASLVNSTNWSNLHLLHEDNKLVAHVGTRILNTTEGVPILLLGGIAVAKEHRGSGYFDKLFEKVINLYKDKVALYVLWSDLDDLYGKYNFHQAGVLIQTGKEAFNDKEAESIGLNRVELSSLEHSKLSELQKCYKSTMETNFVCSKRDARDWGTISAITSSSLYTHETNNVIDFYAICGKGMDLAGIVHEFAGINDTSTKIWMNLLKKYKTWIPAKNPWGELEGNSNFYMGIFRIASPELFSALIHSWSDSKIIVSAISDEEVVFHFEGQEFKNSHKDFFSLLMGPERAVEFLSFPKELWITGLDSI